jgi:hypothetical protein
MNFQIGKIIKLNCPNEVKIKGKILGVSHPLKMLWVLLDDVQSPVSIDFNGVPLILGSNALTQSYLDQFTIECE